MDLKASPSTKSYAAKQGRLIWKNWPEKPGAAPWAERTVDATPGPATHLPWAGRTSPVIGLWTMPRRGLCPKNRCRAMAKVAAANLSASTCVDPAGHAS